jgi:hypothetical protein
MFEIKISLSEKTLDAINNLADAIKADAAALMADAGIESSETVKKAPAKKNKVAEPETEPEDEFSADPAEDEDADDGYKAPAKVDLTVLRELAKAKIDSNKSKGLAKLLKEYGADNLGSLDKADYKAFHKALWAL